MSFTPGPWTFAKTKWLGKDAIWIAQAGNAGPTSHSSDIGDVNLIGMPEEVAIANANLIAAAPELYELLARARDTVSTHAMQTYSRASEKLLKEIDDVLAKARGEK